MRGCTGELGGELALDHHAVRVAERGDRDFEEHFIGFELGGGGHFLDLIWLMELYLGEEWLESKLSSVVVPMAPVGGAIQGEPYLGHLDREHFARHAIDAHDERDKVIQLNSDTTSEEIISISEERMKVEGIHSVSGRPRL